MLSGIGIGCVPVKSWKGCEKLRPELYLGGPPQGTWIRQYIGMYLNLYIYLASSESQGKFTFSDEPGVDVSVHYLLNRGLSEHCTSCRSPFDIFLPFSFTIRANIYVDCDVLE